MKVKKCLSVLLCAALVTSVMTACSGNKAPVSESSGNDSAAQTTGPAEQTRPEVQTSDVKGLVIAEVMSRNKHTLKDKNGDSPDYISIYNGGEKASLKGYYLSDSKSELQLWSFPDVTLEKGEYITLFCDSLDTVDGEEIHTNFSISSDGEDIYFTSPDGNTTQLYVPAMPEDIAYGLVLEGDGSGEYHYFSAGAPGKANTSQHSADLLDIYQAEVPKLLLNEYMTSNGSTIKDNYGQSSDWIEIFNSGSEDTDLSGMSLSDKLSDPGKWQFPEGVSIKAGGYLLVWCDGLDEFKDGNVHTSFKLGEGDDGLVLTDKNGVTVFKTDMERPDKDVSCGLTAEGKYGFFVSPTPGKANASQAVPTKTAEEKPTEDVYISELSASGNSGIDSDWIELGNKASYDADLSGWGVGKNPAAPTYIFENLKIASGKKLLLYADGGSGGVHLPMKLSLDGDKLYLFDENGFCRDKIEFEGISPEHSCGNTQGGETVFYSSPTPGKENAKTTYKGYAPVPEFSNGGGYAEKGEKLTVSAGEGVTVRYTSDGSFPNEKSSVFSSYTINKNCVLKAASYCEGYLPSPVYSATYIVEETHDIPVICLSCDPDELFGEERGIFAYGDKYENKFPYVGANFWQDWEREASFEYYSEDGTRQIGCLTGIKVFGQFSRAYEQKSLSLHFRGKYGCPSVEYPFFHGNPVTEFSSLVLRAGGQDQKFTRLRDAFCAEVFSEYSDVACMDWAPAAVYINGEYYGYYDLREKINESYFESHEGIDKDGIDILKGNGQIVLAGDNSDYYDMVNWIKSHDLSNKKNYEYVCSLMDVDSYIDYLIAEIFFCNSDSGNIKFYREKGGKWKWILYDMDMALRSESTWGESYNSIQKLFDPRGHGSEYSFSTAVQCGLLKNKDFKQKFINRYAQLLNGCFKPENLTAKLDEMTSAVDSEMKIHGKRWERPVYSDWTENVKALRSICEKRHDIAKKQLVDFMGISGEQQKELFK